MAGDNPSHEAIRTKSDIDRTGPDPTCTAAGTDQRKERSDMAATDMDWTYPAWA